MNAFLSETGLAHFWEKIKLYVDSKVGSGLGSGNVPSCGEVYSTEETRIGTWIDGKPLYRKVITDLTCKGSFTQFDVGLSENISFPVRVTAVVYYNSQWIHSNYQSSGGYFLAGMYDSGKVWQGCSLAAVGNPMIFILEYTKISG